MIDEIRGNRKAAPCGYDATGAGFGIVVLPGNFVPLRIAPITRITSRTCCGVTRIGSSNLFMAQAHVAHDCQVGNHAILANGTALSGHVEVQDYATLGGLSGVHQFCRVGTHAFVGGGTVATKDVLPYSLTVGNRARFFGLNLVGLKRRGFGAQQIAALKQACRLLLAPAPSLAEALRRVETEAPKTSEVRTLVEFVRAAKRGVVLERRRDAAESEDEA